MAGTEVPEVVKLKWKYEKRILKCSKCKSDIVIEGDTSSCFAGRILCSGCSNRD